MIRTTRVVHSIALTLLLASCSEGLTEPAATNIPQSPSLAVPTPMAGVAFNSASCTLANSTTGEVRCSWDITNTSGNRLDYWPGAQMAITYNCLNSKGQIRSSGTANAWSYLSYLGVTSTSIIGVNQQLVTAVPHTGTGSSKRYNVCKATQQLQITGYTMLYWHILIDTPTASTCLGSDNRMGCLVA